MFITGGAVNVPLVSLNPLVNVTFEYEPKSIVAPCTVKAKTLSPENPVKVAPAFNVKVPPEAVSNPLPVKVPLKNIVTPIVGSFPSGKLQLLLTVLTEPERMTWLKVTLLQLNVPEFP